MHYNIALLPKKVTNCVTYLLFMESNALRYICGTFALNKSRACFFLHIKIYICKKVLANVKALSHQKA